MVFASIGLRAIFDHGDPVSRPIAQKGIHIRRQASMVHHEHRAGSGSYRWRPTLRIHVERVGIHVGEYRNQALIEDAGQRCPCR